MIATRVRWRTGIGVAAMMAALGLVATMATPVPAEAGVAVGFGFGFPIGYPGYYPPPPPYYPPPYPPPGSYPSPTPYSSPGSYQPSSAYPPPGSATPPPITYTQRPGWTNAQGEYCREYRATQGTGSRATERYGTACRDAAGHWRIVN